MDLHFTISQGVKAPQVKQLISDRSHKINPCNQKKKINKMKIC